MKTKLITIACILFFAASNAQAQSSNKNELVMKFVNKDNFVKKDTTSMVKLNETDYLIKGNLIFVLTTQDTLRCKSMLFKEGVIIAEGNVILSSDKFTTRTDKLELHVPGYSKLSLSSLIK